MIGLGVVLFLLFIFAVAWYIGQMDDPRNYIRPLPNSKVGDYNSHLAFLEMHGVTGLRDEEDNRTFKDALIKAGIDPNKENLTVEDMSKLFGKLE